MDCRAKSYETNLLDAPLPHYPTVNYLSELFFMECMALYRDLMDAPGTPPGQLPLPLHPSATPCPCMPACLHYVAVLSVFRVNLFLWTLVYLVVSWFDASLVA